MTAFARVLREWAAESGPGNIQLTAANADLVPRVLPVAPTMWRELVKLAAYAGARFEGDSPVYAFPVIFTGAEANNLAAALARPLDAALAGTAVVVPRTFDQQTEQPAAQTETGSAIWGTYPPPTGTDWTWWLIGNAPRLRAFIAWLQQSGGFTVSGTPPQPPKPPAPRFVP